MGLGVGGTWGGLLVWVAVRNQAGPVVSVDLLSDAINEILFPLDCALVIFASEALGRRMKGA